MKEYTKGALGVNESTLQGHAGPVVVADATGYGVTARAVTDLFQPLRQLQGSSLFEYACGPLVNEV